MLTCRWTRDTDYKPFPKSLRGIIGQWSIAICDDEEPVGELEIEAVNDAGQAIIHYSATPGQWSRRHLRFAEMLLAMLIVGLNIRSLHARIHVKNLPAQRMARLFNFYHSSVDGDQLWLTRRV